MTDIAGRSEALGKVNKLEMDELRASSELQSDDTPATKEKINQELAKQNP